jgi:hypothetical protein
MARRERRRDPAKERHWRRMVRRWRRSGLSVREFCDWQALSESSFYAWRRELTQRDRKAVTAPPRSAAKSVGRDVQRNGAAGSWTPTFLPVQVVTDPAPQSQGGAPRTNCVEVHLPTGVRLWVPAGCDRQTLANVLAALEAKPC